MIKRKLGLIIIFCIFCTVFTGCFDARELDNLAYTLAVGFDKGKFGNDIKITFQFATPTGGGGDGKKGEGKPAAITVIEAPTIYAGLNMANTFISKQINLSHTKVLIFSKELAESEKFEPYIHAIVRGREFRPSMYMIISRGSAEEYIKAVEPELTQNLSKYYDSTQEAYKYTGFSANSTFDNVYFALESQDEAAVASLAGVNKISGLKDNIIVYSSYREHGRPAPSEGDYKAGSAPKESEQKSEIMGLAVFNRSKMVGELDGADVTFYLMAKGNYGYGYFTIPDPLVKDRFVVLNIMQADKPDNKVDIIEDKPKITTKLSLEADILSIQSGYNYEDIDKVKILEKATEEFLKKDYYRFLNKTSREFESDICGFGKVVKSRFMTFPEWEKFNWLEKYKYSTFDPSVKLKIRRPGLMVRSVS